MKSWKICVACDTTSLARDDWPVCAGCGGLLAAYETPMFLKHIDLQQYIPAFEKHAIALDVLLTLTDADLMEMGVEPLGHRRLIQARARELLSPGRSDPHAVSTGDAALQRPPTGTSTANVSAFQTIALLALISVAASPLLPWFRGGITGFDAHYVGRDSVAAYLVYVQCGLAVVALPFVLGGRLPRLASLLVGFFPVIVFIAFLVSGRRVGRVIKVLEFGIYFAMGSGVLHALMYRRRRPARRVEAPRTEASPPRRDSIAEHIPQRGTSPRQVPHPQGPSRPQDANRHIVALGSLAVVAFAPFLPWAVGGITGFDIASKGGEISPVLYFVYLQVAGALLASPFAFARTLPRLGAVAVGLLPVLSFIVVLVAFGDAGLSLGLSFELVRVGMWVGIPAGLILMTLYLPKARPGGETSDSQRAQQPSLPPRVKRDFTEKPQEVTASVAAARPTTAASPSSPPIHGIQLRNEVAVSRSLPEVRSNGSVERTLQPSPTAADADVDVVIRGRTTHNDDRDAKSAQRKRPHRSRLLVVGVPVLGAIAVSIVVWVVASPARIPDLGVDHPKSHEAPKLAEMEAPRRSSQQPATSSVSPSVSTARSSTRNAAPTDAATPAGPKLEHAASAAGETPVDSPESESNSKNTEQQRIETLESRVRIALSSLDSGDRAESKHLNKLGVLARRDKLPVAIVYYRAAVMADPSYEWAQYNLACEYALQGNRDDALVALGLLASLGTHEARKALHKAISDDDFAGLWSEPYFTQVTTAKPARQALRLPRRGSITGQPGVIQIHAKPWASVSVSGESVGTTPTTVRLKPGIYVIQFQHSGTVAAKIVDVQPGAEQGVVWDFTM